LDPLSSDSGVWLIFLSAGRASVRVCCFLWRCTWLCKSR